ncbi:MAG TPA: gamma-glutamyl-gamma-aminobutyrate hydrolase family protein [Vicinamibacterales bacterium]|jgi:putative glutamine amidotransferase|nr:gamma-glutamyl-gamma-aminobutyrate hydrolase family protein [Vicinamibacterales bacterium]
MPLIAITKTDKFEDYKHAVLNAGGEVRVVEAGMNVDTALEGVHGVLLSGGEDIGPELYGEQPLSALGTVSAARDAFEIPLAQEARRRGVAILGICRGIQTMNVAFGGSLVQDIPSQVPGALPHSFKVPEFQAFHLAHDLWIENDTLLDRLMRERLSDTDACVVNSRHHQAVKRIADGFIAAATAPDGIIEAIEDPAARFCMGVQWHPENFWRTGEFRPIFEGFLEAALQR